MDQASNEVYDFIFKLDRRIGYLEKDLTFIEKKITGLDSYKGHMYDSLHEEVDSAKLLINDMKSQLKNIAIGINGLSSDMKDVIKKDQADSLTVEVDGLPLNEYITKNELKKYDG